MGCAHGPSQLDQACWSLQTSASWSVPPRVARGSLRLLGGQRTCSDSNGRHHLQAYKGTIRHLDRNAEKSGKPSLGTGNQRISSVPGGVTKVDCLLSGHAGFPGHVIRFSGNLVGGFRSQICPVRVTNLNNFMFLAWSHPSLNGTSKRPSHSALRELAAAKNWEMVEGKKWIPDMNQPVQGMMRQYTRVFFHGSLEGKHQFGCIWKVAMPWSLLARCRTCIADQTVGSAADGFWHDILLPQSWPTKFDQWPTFGMMLVSQGIHYSGHISVIIHYQRPSSPHTQRASLKNIQKQGHRWSSSQAPHIAMFRGGRLGGIQGAAGAAFHAQRQEFDEILKTTSSLKRVKTASSSMLTTVANSPKWIKLDGIHQRYVRRAKLEGVAWILSTKGSVFIGIAIAVQSFVLGLELQFELEADATLRQQGGPAFYTLLVVDCILLVVFTLEYVLRSRVLKWKYMCSSMGLLDLILVLSAGGYIVVVQLSSLQINGTLRGVVRAIRLLRILRVVHLLQIMPALALLVKGLVSTIITIMDAMILLAILSYIGGSCQKSAID